PAEHERVLDHLHTLVGQASKGFGGTLHASAVDDFFLTFPEATAAMAAAAQLCDQWELFRQRHPCDCAIGIAVHAGDLYAYRSFLYGNDMIDTWSISQVARALVRDRNAVFVSGRVERALA